MYLLWSLYDHFIPHNVFEWTWQCGGNSLTWWSEMSFPTKFYDSMKYYRYDIK